MQTSVSVIICCYNSATRIIPTLTALKNQRLNNGISVEIILVDNNCSDNTVEVSNKYWEETNCSIPLKTVKENKSGLTYAREKGILTSTGEILIFCDDDNSFNPEYIQRVLTFFNKDFNKEVGIIGGYGIADIGNSIKPVWFERISNRYAVGAPFTKSQFANNVYGAGMAIKRSVYNEIKASGFTHQLSDRKGNSLSSGGDTEICFAAILLGYKIWWDVENTFYHVIPAQRITKDYIIRMFIASGKTSAILTGINHIVTGSPQFKIGRRIKDDIRNTFKKMKSAILRNEWFLLYLWLLEKRTFWLYYLTNKKQIDASFERSFWFSNNK